MLMATEPSRKIPRTNVPNILDPLRDPDLIAVCAFSAIGLLITIVLARVFPPDKAVDVLMLFD